MDICQVLDKTKKLKNTPKGIRIPVCSVKGSCPRPLDDGGSILYFHQQS